MQETWETRVQSLGQEDLLEEGMATHSSVLAWRIPWTEDPGEQWSIRSQRGGHDWSKLAHMHTRLFPSLLLFTFLLYLISLPSEMQGYMKVLWGSVQFSHSVVSDSLQPHILQHISPPCPSPTPGVYWNSCPLSQWCHPAISSSVIPFSSCLQSFLASGSFQMSQFFTSRGQSIGVSASASVLPMNIQDWFPLGLTGLISLQSKGLFSNTTVKKHQFFGAQLFYSPILTSIHDY